MRISRILHDVVFGPPAYRHTVPSRLRGRDAGEEKRKIRSADEPKKVHTDEVGEDDSVKECASSIVAHLLKADMLKRS